ncbi:hypothetical protein OXT66_03425 [Lentilactobacillus senioris]|nr:hypothetical protein [Lentilactobacillus senioris]MCY9806601.1 hypothetical protein [Lentilactobacillus senioris]
MKKNTAAMVITCTALGVNAVISTVALSLLTNHKEMEVKRNGR